MKLWVKRRYSWAWGFKPQTDLQRQMFRWDLYLGPLFVAWRRRRPDA
jgi:hypothetical protein